MTEIHELTDTEVAHLNSLVSQERIAQRLSVFFDALGWPRHGRQKRLEHELALTKSQVTKTMRGHQMPPYRMLVQLHLNYDLNINWLLSGEGPLVASGENVSREVMLTDQALTLIDQHCQANNVDLTRQQVRELAAFAVDEALSDQSEIDTDKLYRMIRIAHRIS